MARKDPSVSEGNPQLDAPSPSQTQSPIETTSVPAPLLAEAQEHHQRLKEGSSDISRPLPNEPAPFPPLTKAVTVEAPYSIFTTRVKWGLVLLVSTAGLFSPLSANIFLPVIPSIATDLNVSVEQVNLSVTWYMILQGVSPSIFGSIADVIGRRPVYLVTFLIYIGASIGLANTHVYWLLVVLRCVQASGSASVIAIGSGSIGDLSSPSERGGFMGAFSLGAMLGPCIGPVVGGLLAGAFGWQSLFWFLAASGGVVFVIMAAVLPETLRSIVGNGSIPAHGVNRSLLSLLRDRRHRNDPVDPNVIVPAMPPKKGWKDIRLLAPLKMFREKDVLSTLTFNSAVYTLFYTVTTSTSTSFKSTYHLSESEIGLCFLANGGGCLVASIFNGPRMNADYRKVAEQVEAARAAQKEETAANDDGKKRDLNDLSSFPIEHARLRSLPVFFGLLIASTIIYGWVLDKGVHLSVPLIMQFIVGLSVTSIFNSISTLLVDMYPGQSASATAANNLYRCLCGAAGTAVIDPIINALGPGWAFTMLSLLCCCFVPLIVLEWRCGMRFRAERAARLKRRAERKAAKKLEKGGVEQ
ncbi:major facilitator superfamily domain-containing protein [Leucosporidium creatinivorum]|uniref:Major facilitator superfamily domain-containing protein n=1 Tax=Leucosporidium creatinivorum TaxID=106004 RepID=A0A1Y2DZN6_9BASI|nr:major facilitator superfamily domain-containing protein [Leucosporidium creatinivorum]